MLRRIYSLFLLLATPLIPLRLLLRGFRQRGYWQNVGVRWGRYAQGRLGDVQALCGAGEAAPVDDLHEVLELADFHRSAARGSERVRERP